MSVDHNSNLAVLIDGDNVSSKIIVGLMTEIANYGTSNVKRIYGDWTSSAMNSWKPCLLQHSITPIQQFAYTKGKNATDGSMIIDAMDLLYTGRFSAFCIVSSDSDFIRLAQRIREQGAVVYGFGEEHTPSPFVAACDKFVYFDALDLPIEESAQNEVKPRDRIFPERFKRPIDARVRVAIHTAIEVGSNDIDGYAKLANIGDHLKRVAPDLNPRNYGYTKMLEFIEASGIVETKWLHGHPMVRIKRKSVGSQGSNHKPPAVGVKMS